MRTGSLLLAIVMLAAAAYIELVILFPAPAYLYVLAVVGAIIVTLSGGPGLEPRRRLAIAAALTIAAIAFYVTPWSSRKPFLRDLHSVHTGMSAEQVRQQMSSYEQVPDHGLPPSSRLSFRHSDHGQFNADFGHVYFSDGRVTHIEFSAD